MDNQMIEPMLNERLRNYLSIVQNNVLEYANFIVEVGALTVGTDNSGKIIAQNVLYPTQFSEKAIDVIKSMNWQNGNGEKVEPIVCFRNDWYRKKISNVEETLALLKQNSLEGVKIIDA